MKPSYEELELQLKTVQELLKSALNRIAELETQINRNSKNSSKPPSSDQKGNTPDNQNKKPKMSRQGKARTLYPTERVNQHVSCTREKCPHCQSSQIYELRDPPFVWQQIELPDVRAIVTQFNCHRYRCEQCDLRSVGELPAGVPFSAFGPKLMALITNLTGRFHLAKREAMQLIYDLYEVELSEGSVINIEENIANALDGVYERIHRCIIEGTSTRYFDETPWRNRGKRQYVWIATSKTAAYYKIDPNRSQEAFFKVIGTHTSNPSVTDRYGVYHSLDGPHQYCLAHLIRDFHSFAEQSGETGQIGEKIEYELRRACRIHAEWRDGSISRKQKGIRLAHSKRRLDELFTEGIAFGNDELEALCWRLNDDYEHLWTFARIDGMEPTNNMAERDLRKLVLWRKKSYGTRSERGQRYVERISSVVETVKKNGCNVLDFLEMAIQAFYRKQPPPYINQAAGI